MKNLINQNNEVLGFSETYYSGITTERMSMYVKKIVLQNLSIAGLYNVSSLPISKLELLKIFKFEVIKGLRFELSFLYFLKTRLSTVSI